MMPDDSSQPAVPANASVIIRPHQLYIRSFRQGHTYNLFFNAAYPGEEKRESKPKAKKESKIPWL